jgi:hypothetical protein
MATSRVWILGADDPEMTAIERLLIACGERVEYATIDWQRVTLATAYRARDCTGTAWGSVSHMVECDAPPHDGCTPAIRASVVRIDHHRPGDPGYGVPPEQFLLGSSLGQVLAELARLGALDSGEDSAGYSGPGCVYYWDGRWWVDGLCGAMQLSEDMILPAAADHCLGHAYAGRCPGVDPDELLRWRVSVRAAQQGRPEVALLEDIERARIALIEATQCPWPDLRNRHVPELPEAACRYGYCYLASITDPAGRQKVVFGGATTPDDVRRFLGEWAPAHGLVDCYGVPERGFAGGYLQ